SLSSRRPHTRFSRDWSSDVCSSDLYPEGGLVPLSRTRVEGIASLGGTILGTTNRGNPLRFPVKQADGTTIEVDRTDELVRAFAQTGRAPWRAKQMLSSSTVAIMTTT